MVEFDRLKLATLWPLIPCSAPPLIAIRSRVTLVTFWRWIAALSVVFWPSERPVLLATLSAVPALVKFMFLSVMSAPLMTLTPRCAVFWIVPPEPAVVPVPVIVRPPAEPVVLRTIPLIAPLTLTLWKLRSAAPMLVFWTLMATTLPEPIVLPLPLALTVPPPVALNPTPDRKSTRLNSSHGYISYAVFCLKKKKIKVVMAPHSTV